MTGKGSTLFASTTGGESVSFGARVMHTKWRLWITTEEK
jgi:hypothetical protein